ncbi:hypothetical protein M434DRAFT_230816 [Hypoxylon sp. CO27-5]|nr:hypothetical protein M434DRAFT_230816 [Hypoxylon sp. CO27-5]
MEGTYFHISPLCGVIIDVCEKIRLSDLSAEVLSKNYEALSEKQVRIHSLSLASPGEMSALVTSTHVTGRRNVAGLPDTVGTCGLLTMDANILKLKLYSVILGKDTLCRLKID